MRSGEERAGRAAGSCSDEMLNEFAVVAPRDRLAAALQSRFDGLVDRISLYVPYDVPDGLFDETVATLAG